MRIEIHRAIFSFTMIRVLLILLSLKPLLKRPADYDTGHACGAAFKALAVCQQTVRWRCHRSSWKSFKRTASQETRVLTSSVPA